MLKARLQQYVNRELPDVQAGFRKGRGTRGQIANIRWIMEKVREFQKNIYFCFIDYAKAFDCVDHNKLWKILKEMGIQDHLTCLWRNLYADQEATVRTGYGTTALTYSFFYLKPVCCSMSSSNCCFLTCIQVSQEAGQVLWYSLLFQNFPQFSFQSQRKAMPKKAQTTAQMHSSHMLVKQCSKFSKPGFSNM